MRKILVGFLVGSYAAGAFSISKSYNVTDGGGVSGTGDAFVTLGENGVDGNSMIPEVTCGSGAADTDVATPSVINVSDTVKRIQWRDKGGALVDPPGDVTLAFYRVTPS